MGQELPLSDQQEEHMGHLVDSTVTKGICKRLLGAGRPDGPPRCGGVLEKHCGLLQVNLSLPPEHACFLWTDLASPVSCPQLGGLPPAPAPCSIPELDLSLGLISLLHVSRQLD